ncbi:MAG TPA: kelch repeat-containing protein, partial [Burkholderiales bacterium]
AAELLGASANGKLYVFCGLAPGWKPLGLVYEYDPASDKWTKKKPMPLASHHVSFAEHKGKIYAFGGFTLPQSAPPAWVPIDNAWEYDPAGDSWRALAPLPTKRGSPVAVSAGDRIYVIGGAVPGPGQAAVHPARPHTSVGTVEEYDPASNTWRGRASMPTPRNHMVGGAINGKVYVASGRVGAAFISGGSTNIGVTEAYDPATDSWSQGLARMADARSAAAGGVYDGKLYITGGEYQTPGMMATFRSLEAYDPVANAWQTLRPMPVSRHGLAGAVVGNRLHMVSGDVQSAGTGVHVHTDSHDAYELSK